MACLVLTQSLPDFGDRLRARDCELMLQYLTVPYIRIPLVIKFFSDPVRMQVLYLVLLQRGKVAIVANTRCCSLLIRVVVLLLLLCSLGVNNQVPSTSANTWCLLLTIQPMPMPMPTPTPTPLQALWSEDLQEVLDASLFEPAQWQVG